MHYECKYCDGVLPMHPCGDADEPLICSSCGAEWEDAKILVEDDFNAMDEYDFDILDEIEPIDEYQCPICGHSNETCFCDDYPEYDFDDSWAYPDDDFEELEEIVCEVNGKPMTKSELEDYYYEMESKEASSKWRSKNR